MEKLSPKLARGYGPHYVHWCPACKTDHLFAVDQPLANGARWSFDGDLEAPSFSPSMKIEWSHRGGTIRCHYFIKAGMIEYCADSTHAMAGHTVPLPDLPEDFFSEDA